MKKSKISDMKYIMLILMGLHETLEIRRYDNKAVKVFHRVRKLFTFRESCFAMNRRKKEGLL